MRFLTTDLMTCVHLAGFTLSVMNLTLWGAVWWQETARLATARRDGWLDGYDAGLEDGGK